MINKVKGTDLKTDELISVESIYCKSSYLTSNWKRDQNYPIFIKLQVHCMHKWKKVWISNCHVEKFEFTG